MITKNNVVVGAALLVMLFTFETWAQNPRIAVYDASGNEVLVRYASIALRNNGFQVVDRSNVINAELLKQASGEVDDDEAVSFGRQFGVPIICVVGYAFSHSPESGVEYYQLSTRIIDVETMEILALGIERYTPQGSTPVSTVVNSAVKKMLKTMRDRSDPNIPKLAVYIQGHPSNNSSFTLYTHVLDVLFTSGRYNNFTLVDRSAVIGRIVGNELMKQYSGEVDDAQIVSMGRQYGVKHIIAVPVQNHVGMINVITARMINVETADIERTSKMHTVNLNANTKNSPYKFVAESMIRDIIGEATTEERNEARQKGKSTRTIEQKVTLWACLILLGACVIAGIAAQ